jgi:hypothetical protein
MILAQHFEAVCSSKSINLTREITKGDCLMPVGLFIKSSILVVLNSNFPRAEFNKNIKKFEILCLVVLND